MRDVTITEDRVITRTVGPGANEYDLYHMAGRTYRSDLQYGPRRDDGFLFPTNYQAFFSHTENKNFRYDSGLFGQDVVVSGRSASGALANKPAYHGFDTAFGIAYPEISQNTLARCRTEVLQKLKSGDFNAAVFIGELNEAAALVTATAVRLRAALRFLRNRRFSEAFSALGIGYANHSRDLSQISLHDAWLAMKYGWLPLLNDAYGMLDAMTRKWTDYPPILSAKRVIKEPLGSFYRTNVLNYEEKGDCYKGVEIQLFYSVRSELLHGLTSLGLTNPLSVAWELMPFSFVIDWFLPIGNFFDALDAPMGLDFLTGYELTFARSDFEVQYFYPIHLPPSDNEGNDIWPQLKVKSRGMNRKVLASFPAPQPYFRANGVNFSNVASSIALLTQLRI